MLNVSALVMLSHQLTCLVLCLGLSGIAVGLGARLPNLREQSPSRIAAGFGGTLNLVISTLYILVVVLLTALPTHFYLAAQYAEHGMSAARGAVRACNGGSDSGWIAGTVGQRSARRRRHVRPHADRLPRLPEDGVLKQIGDSGMRSGIARRF